jgi:selenocysteine lyase/cysteine desulfurase
MKPTHGRPPSPTPLADQPKSTTTPTAVNNHDVVFGPIDVDAVRQSTPACLRRVFLLSAGSSLPSTTTLDAVMAHLRLEAEIGGYTAAERAADTLAQGRVDLAALIGGGPDEVALVPSDSVGWVKAWWGWVVGGNVPAGSTVVVDRMCYHSHYAAIDQTSRLADFTVRVAPALPDGTVDMDQLEIGDDVSAVCITMIGTHSGNVNPVPAIGRKTAAAGVPIFLDACQAVGHLDLDVAELGCDVLTGTGRKFLRGPRGSGLLWVSRSIVDRFAPPGIDATSTPWTTSNGMQTHAGIGRFEEYEVSYASMVGLAAAAREALTLGPAAIEQRVVALAEALRTRLASIDGVVVRDTAAQRCGIVTFTVDGVAPTRVVATASEAGITINECTATWAALDMEAKRTPSVVRASPHYFNTLDEVENLAEVIDQLDRSRSR